MCGQRAPHDPPHPDGVLVASDWPGARTRAHLDVCVLQGPPLGWALHPKTSHAFSHCSETPLGRENLLVSSLHCGSSGTLTGHLSPACADAPLWASSCQHVFVGSQAWQTLQGEGSRSGSLLRAPRPPGPLARSGSHCLLSSGLAKNVGKLGGGGHRKCLPPFKESSSCGGRGGPVESCPPAKASPHTQPADGGFFSLTLAPRERAGTAVGLDAGPCLVHMQASSEESQGFPFGLATVSLAFVMSTLTPPAPLGGSPCGGGVTEGGPGRELAGGAWLPAHALRWDPSVQWPVRCLALPTDCRWGSSWRCPGWLPPDNTRTPFEKLNPI